jgi:glycosyltransferase involved in cell wall biosynthesis
MSARATVIIPTFSQARFARWAIKSVQQQTVKDIEICVICDGSSQKMVSFFEDMVKEDPRIRVFAYSKSIRTGEPYRDEVIKKMTGEIVCYCCHDDLWFPNHIEVMEKALKKCDFTHTYHAIVNNQEKIKRPQDVLLGVHFADLSKRKTVNSMLYGTNYFGLTYAAHTRSAYGKLKEGWVTTPDKNIPTDLFMWKKFLSSSEIVCGTTKQTTALTFPVPLRKELSEKERDNELASYFGKMSDAAFEKQINRLSQRKIRLRLCKDAIKRVPFILRIWQALKIKKAGEASGEAKRKKQQ